MNNIFDLLKNYKLVIQETGDRNVARIEVYLERLKQKEETTSRMGGVVFKFPKSANIEYR